MNRFKYISKRKKNTPTEQKNHPSISEQTNNQSKNTLFFFDNIHANNIYVPKKMIFSSMRID